jgi:hypothetical protein
MLGEAGFHIFRLWGNHGQDFDLKEIPPQRSRGCKQPSTRKISQQLYVPIPVEVSAGAQQIPQDRARLLPVSSAERTPQPECRQPQFDLPSYPGIDPRQALYCGIESLEKERRKLFAMAQNAKSNADFRAKCSIEKILVEAQLRLCRLELQQPGKYWQKLLEEESIRSENRTPEQILQVPDLKELLDAAVFYHEFCESMEQEQNRLAGIEEPDADARALSYRLANELDLWRSGLFGLRREICPPPPQEMCDFEDEEICV